MTIVDVLYYGAASARTKAHIAAELGMTERAVEAAIQEARLSGAAICSDENGYWIGNAAEVADTARRLRNRYITQAITARALRRTAKRLEGIRQTELWAA